MLLAIESQAMDAWFQVQSGDGKRGTMSGFRFCGNITLRKAIGFLLCFTFLVSSQATAALAQEATHLGTTHKVNLDMSSQAATATARHLSPTQQVNIQVGDTIQAVTAGSKLTPAELVAVHQILRSGTQSIQIGAQGAATGGTFTIGGRLSQHINSLVIPQGVTVIDNVARATTLNMTGNLVNNGTFYVVSTSAGAASTAVINAANIINGYAALLTTVLPGSGIAGIANPATHVNLVLNAVNNILNYGVISSSGSLTATAGGSIINALPSGVAGSAPIMRALNNVNLTSSNIINAGLIASTTANINLAAVNSSQLLLKNTAGALQALSGVINVHTPDYTGTSPISITGGDLLSKELNIFGDHGNVTVDVGSVSGAMNITGCGLRVNVESGDERIGRLVAYGDPLITDGGAGVVYIESSITTNGAPLSIISRGDIAAMAADCSIDTSSTTGAGGNILLAAGANWQMNNGVLTFNGASATGGGIILDFSNSHGATYPIAALDSRGGKGALSSNLSGGNITLVAYLGSGGPTSDLPGTILLPSDITVKTGGTGTGSSGNFLVIAGGAGELAHSVSLSLGSVDTTSVNAAGLSTGSGGNILLYTAAPTGSVSINAATGAIISSTLAPSTTYMNAAVQTGNLTTANGGNITILAGDNITTGGLSVFNANQTAYSGPGSSITLAAGITVPGGEITVSGIGSTPGTTNNAVWHTLGLTTSAQSFQVGLDLIQQLTNQASGSDPVASANEELNSGSTIPVEQLVPAGTTLYKLRPTGWGSPSPYTPYWFTYSDLQSLLSDPGQLNQIANKAGLPPNQVTGITSYDIFGSIEI